MELRLEILVEETARRTGLLAEHGLSFYVEFGGKRFLFDTGQLFALQWNAERLNVDFSSLDFVALSHGHYDHTGGLEAVLKTRGNPLPVFAHPDVFRERFHRKPDGLHAIGIPKSRQAYEALGAIFHLNSGWSELAPGIHLTGEISRKTAFESGEPDLVLQTENGLQPDPIHDDQALVLETSKGAVLLLGCGHSGFVNTLKAVQQRLHLDYFYRILGGFHLTAAPEERIRKTVEALGQFSFHTISPMHCTGFRARAALWRAFPEQFEDLHTGDLIQF